MTAPTGLDELLFSRVDGGDFVESVNRWIDEASDDILCIEASQVGCGVTTMLGLFEQTKSNVAFVRSPVDTMSARNVIGQKNVIVIDDLDSFTAYDFQRVATCIEQCKVPIILAGWHRRCTQTKIQALVKQKHGKRVKTIAAPRLTSEIAVAYLASLGHPDPDRAWKTTHGDLRACILSIATGDVYDTFPDGVDGLTELLSAPSGTNPLTYDQRVRMVSCDPTLFVNGVFENYITCVDQPDIEACSRILDSLAHCDFLETAMYRNPAVDFHGHIAATVGAVPSTTNALCPSKPIETHGTVWARYNHYATKRKTVQSIERAGVQFDDIAFVSDMAMSMSERGLSVRDASSLSGVDPGVVWSCTTLNQRAAKRRKYTRSKHRSVFGL